MSGPVSLGMAGGGTRNGVSESHRVYDALCCRQSAPGRRHKPSSRRQPQQQTRGQYRNHETIAAETRAVEWWPSVELSASCAVSLISPRPLGWWWRVAASSAQPLQQQGTQAGSWPSTAVITQTPTSGSQWAVSRTIQRAYSLHQVFIERSFTVTTFNFNSTPHPPNTTE